MIGSMLETYRVHEKAIELLLMRIEFMLLVELMEHGKPPKFKPIINLSV